MYRLLHCPFQLIEVAFLDQLFNKRSIQEDLAPARYTTAVYRWQQSLRYHRVQIESKLKDDLGMLASRKKV